MIERLTLKSGQQSIRINGIQYHSSYNPEKEADRFIATTIDRDSPSTVIICGPGFGYLVTAVKKRFPGVKIISLFYSKELEDTCLDKGTVSWNPDSPEDLSSFLYRTLSELDIEGLQTIEWPAGVSLFPDIADQVHESLTQVIKEMRGSLVTTMAMGRLWIKNSFSNFIHHNNVYTGIPIPPSNPIVLTASGPGLIASIDLLKKWRNRICIMSLPSAVTCLLSYNITPDIIVMTDPGYYSRIHLQWTDIPSGTLFMPLSAATGLWEKHVKVILFSQPHFFEELLLDKINTSFISIPPKGTVAATAMDIALRFSASYILIAGLDLCFQDILSHARPHAFDALLIENENRLSPYYHRQFSRSHFFAPEYNREHKTRTSLSLRTYEGWFQSLPPGMSKRLIRINPSPIHIRGTGTMNTSELDSFLSGQPIIRKDEDQDPATSPDSGIPTGTGKIKKITPYPGQKIRKEFVKEIINTWKTEILGADKKIRDTNSITPLIENQKVLRLIYFLNLKELTSIKRTVRLKGESAGIEDTLVMMESAMEFLDKYSGKLNNGKMTEGM